MDMFLGALFAYISGAVMMYEFLNITERLRKENYERELLAQIKYLKRYEEEYIEEVRKRNRETELEEAKWAPKDVNLTQAQIEASMTSTMEKFFATFAAKQADAVPFSAPVVVDEVSIPIVPVETQEETKLKS